MAKTIVMMSLVVLAAATVAALPCKIEGGVFSPDGSPATDVFVQVTNLDTAYSIASETGVNMPPVEKYISWYNIDLVCSPGSHKIVVEAIKDGYYGKEEVVPKSTLTFLNLSLNTELSQAGVTITETDKGMRIAKNGELAERLQEIRINAFEGDIVALGLLDIGILLTGDAQTGLRKNVVRVHSFMDNGVTLNISSQLKDFTIGDMQYLLIDNENISINLKEIDNDKAVLAVMKVRDYQMPPSDIEKRLDQLKEHEEDSAGAETGENFIVVNNYNLNWVVVLIAGLIILFLLYRRKRAETENRKQNGNKEA